MSALPLGRQSVWPLLIAPALVLAAFGLLKISSDLVYIGPWDRATFGWAVPVPMLLIAPAVSGLAARSAGERPAVIALLVVAAGIGLLVMAYLAGSIDRIGCAVVTDKAHMFGHFASVGVVAAAGFALAGWFALANRRSLVAGVVGGVILSIATWAAILMTLQLLSPALMCAPG